MPTLTPSLWFDKNAEEAATFYVAIFPNSRVVNVQRSPADNPSGKKGEVLTVDWELDGKPYNGINGGPDFKFNEAISLFIACKDQAEIDYYWNKLTQGGDPAAQQCGWLKDKYGVSWQVAPEQFDRLLGDPNDPGSQRAMEAMMEMKKIDIAKLEEAKAGAGAGAR